MKRKKNIYFDRKSMGFKLGKKPLSKEERRKQAAIKKQEKAHERMAAQAARKQAKQEAAALFKQLKGDAKPQRKPRTHAPRWTADDESAWQQLLKSNPQRVFPGDLSVTEIRALRKLAAKRGKSMATKKRCKKKNSRKRKMPAGLAAYWRKKRAAKAKWKNPREKRAKRRNRIPRKPRPVHKVKRVRRRQRVNPPRKRRVKIIKTSLRKGTKAFRQFVAQTRARYGSARVL